ncbi:aspartate kinase [Vibrio sp. Isolate23]|uniref:amino acid kinase family protein n=1 Tax=Vibrio sp. Isolate23 TaxID=2908533 RepID=UPI001EFD5C4C|nr:aspartate kinase [Vibrio sp. Isolate23]MCG9683432.1 aspartate kinase [Vibrio sp. Isolate23]
MSHTVEKVSGSSMSAFDAVLDNIILKPEPRARYNRIFVVPAYQGITDALLENHRTFEPGVYQYILSGGEEWESQLDSVIQRLLLVNESVFADPILRRKADEFILERVSCTRQWIRHYLSTRKPIDDASHQYYWQPIRERLASIGEAHSAYNTALKAKRHGVQTRFIDLAGPPNEPRESLDSQVWNRLEGVDLNCELPVVTAYASCERSDTCHDDRRYGDLTLSRIAALTEAKQAVIHQCSHLSSGDPDLIGTEQVNPIGQSSYQVANELSALSHNLVHPDAIEELSQENIDLQVKCTFEPEHPGTVISHDHCSTEQKVDVVTGRDDVCVLKIILTEGNSDLADLKHQLFSLPNVNLLHHDERRETLCYYFDCSVSNFGKILTQAKKCLPNAELTVQRVALLSVLGAKILGEQTLRLGCQALEMQGILPDNIHYSEGDNSVKFAVASVQFRAALCALHDVFLNTTADRNH